MCLIIVILIFVNWLNYYCTLLFFTFFFHFCSAPKSRKAENPKSQAFFFYQKGQKGNASFTKKKSLMGGETARKCTALFNKVKDRTIR